MSAASWAIHEAVIERFTPLLMVKRFRWLKPCRAIGGKIPEHKARGAGYYEREHDGDPGHRNLDVAYFGKEPEQEIQQGWNCDGNDERENAPNGAQDTFPR